MYTWNDEMKMFYLGTGTELASSRVFDVKIISVWS